MNCYVAVQGRESGCFMQMRVIRFMVHKTTHVLVAQTTFVLTVIVMSMMKTTLPPVGWKCTYCDQFKCLDCTGNHKCIRRGCNKVICAECVESKGEGGGACDDCLKDFCSSECQYLHCDEDWEKACSKCTQSTATYFRSKCQDYKKENEELCQGMDDLYKKYMNED